MQNVPILLILLNLFISSRGRQISSGNCNFPKVTIVKLDNNATELWDTVGTSLKFPKELPTISIRLRCEHDRPIRWILNQDRESTLLTQPLNSVEENHTASVTRRIFTDFRNVSTYIYSAKYYLTLDTSSSHVFFCVPFSKSRKCGGNISDRSVVVAESETGSKSFVVRLLPRNEADWHSLVQQFRRKTEEKLKEEVNINGNDTSGLECPLNLTIGVHESLQLITFWDPPCQQYQESQAKNAQSLRNYDYFVPELKKECIKYIGSEEIIDFCEEKECASLDFDFHELFPFEATCATGDYKRSVRITFDLNDPPGIHDFRYPVDYSTMLLLSLKRETEINGTLEGEFYKGESIIVKCSSSVAYFSLGSVIAWKRDGISEHLNYVTVTDSELAAYGGFDTKRVLTIDRNYLVKNAVDEVEIICLAPHWDSGEWSNISRTVSFIHSELPNIELLSFNMLNNSYSVVIDKFVSAVEGSRNYRINCTATGIPLPELEFFLPQENLLLERIIYTTNDSVTLSLIIDKLDLSYNGVYSCKAKNVIGETIELFVLKVSKDEWWKTLIQNLIIVGGCLALLIILVAVFLVVKLKREKVEFRKETELAIQKFHEGFSQSENMNFKAEGEHKGFEVPLIRWGIGNTLLGSGAFGIVQKGIIYHGDNRQSVVAVKTVNSPKNVSDFEASLMELTIMAYIGKHEHIVSLVGACTDNIGRRSILIGVEYCANGDLLQYLKRHRTIFTSVVVDGQLQLEKQLGDYRNITVGNFSTLDLYKWSYQIASGMSYLTNKKVLHADLAARNVLLTSDNIAKISDFGLSRQLIQSDNYTKKTNMPLPWKHMAIESLKFIQFSVASDVWSYGVTLWEIFTLGEEPWEGCVWTAEFAEQLERGRRMRIPRYATENLYSKVMLECWRNEAESRMGFEFYKHFFETAVLHLNTPEGKEDSFLNTVC